MSSAGFAIQVSQSVKQFVSEIRHIEMQLGDIARCQKLYENIGLPTPEKIDIRLIMPQSDSAQTVKSGSSLFTIFNSCGALYITDAATGIHLAEIMNNLAWGQFKKKFVDPVSTCPRFVSD